ncbi:Os06g0666266 [Oryza sativa Japonica Group]|nr:Os06g0666266 [Oryza sativa Japonica Group]
MPSPRRDAYRRAYEMEERRSSPPRYTTLHRAFTPPEPGWTVVRSCRRRRGGEHSSPDHRPDSWRQGRGTGRRVALSLEEFKARTRGRSFVCLARDHRASVCQDPPRCFVCNRSSHRARYCNFRPPVCPSPKPTRPPPSKNRARSPLPPLLRHPPPTTLRRRCSPPTPRDSTPSSPPLPLLHRRQVPEILLPPPPSGIMAQLGDPETRPLEDIVFIPTSHAIDAELRE